MGRNSGGGSGRGGRRRLGIIEKALSHGARSLAEVLQAKHNLVQPNSIWFDLTHLGSSFDPTELFFHVFTAPAKEKDMNIFEI